MKKRTIFLVLLISMFCIGALSGYWIGKFYLEEKYKMRENYLSILNSVLRYSSQADVAHELKQKNYAKALCIVEVEASALITRVRACLDNDSCKQLVEPEIRQIAPELLGYGDLKIRYFSPGELCR